MMRLWTAPPEQHLENAAVMQQAATVQQQILQEQQGRRV
jgi:hypothetical protein